MKKLLGTALVLSLFAVGFTASDEPNTTPGGTTPTAPTVDLTGIAKVTKDIAGWDAGYVTPLGTFCYDKNIDESKEGEYAVLSFMTKDSSDHACLVANTTDYRPTQLVTTKGNIYFSFPNDSILELLYDNGMKMEMIDSIPYLKSALPGLQEALKGDALKGILANTGLLLKLNKGMISNPQLSKLVPELANAFQQVSNLPYEDNQEYIDKLPKNSEGDYVFAQQQRDWFFNNVTTLVKNVLSLWTGNATFKVGGSSCTLAASVFCSSDIYNDYGKYGIVCDENPAKLKVGEAEYEGTGYQGKGAVSYEVDFRGFKPNTTYYYTAFYKFDSADHGGIVAKYGDSNADVIYDTTVKSFTTGENVLTVDVVMCIDVTGSMSGIINTVKHNAIEFYDTFEKCCQEEGIQLAALNTQVVDFRDKNEDRDWLNVSETFSLPTQRDEYRNYVNCLNASGGGDAPESGLEALQAAFSKKDWGVDDGYHRQVVILWTDAPYLIPPYSDLTVEEMEAQWNTLPSGRRLILFAPYGAYGEFNGGNWGNLDTWKNLIHETDLTNGFNNFEYILKSIIGELTSKGVPDRKPAPRVQTSFRPNN